jgi:PBP1b-binding outer membrane lipoprotein LpoB
MKKQMMKVLLASTFGFLLLTGCSHVPAGKPDPETGCYSWDVMCQNQDLP